MSYWIGVLIAILSGISSNFGTVLQKKVVNQVSNEAKFMRSLIKKPLWILGFILQLVVGVALFILAQIFIGPTLIPGLMAAGLIILAIGSVKIVGEELKGSEIIGILLMIIAITFIGLSNMEIPIDEINFIDFNLIIRISIFTVFFISLSIIFHIFQKKKIRTGISAALISGFCLTLSNFWISPLMGVITKVLIFKAASFIEIVIFIASAITLVLVNFVSIIKIQQSFKHGQASNMIPVQQFPMQIAPPFYYLAVYLLPVKYLYSVPFLILGVGLVILSSFLLGKRQAEIEKIK